MGFANRYRVRYRVRYRAKLESDTEPDTAPVLHDGLPPVPSDRINQLERIGFVIEFGIGFGIGFELCSIPNPIPNPIPNQPPDGLLRNQQRADKPSRWNGNPKLPNFIKQQPNRNWQDVDEIGWFGLPFHLATGRPSMNEPKFLYICV